MHRHKTGTVYAYKRELDTWWTSRGQQIESDLPGIASPPISWWRRARLAALAVGLLVAVGLSWFALRPEPQPQPKLIPLTTYPGIEGAPSLSPDGNQVAFVRNGDIFIKQVDDERAVQLTSTPEVESAPVWSPDGRQIAFRRGPLILTTSPLGGVARRVAETRTPPMLARMSWTADSKSLVISEMTSSICASLFIVSVASGEKRRLTWPPEPSIGDGWPAVSPDGRTVGFARYPQDSSANIYLLPLGGGEPRRITNERATIFGLTWTPEGNEVVFSCDRSGAQRLWRITANSSSEPSPLPVEGAGENARFPSFSHPGERKAVRLAYQRFEQNLDIRRAEMAGEATSQHVLKSSSLFLPSTRSEAQPQFSPDGKKIAFVSQRSGPYEIWLSDSDGSNLMRLTAVGGPILVGPRWSPDGLRIAFHATTGRLGKYQNYVIDVAGGSPVRISRDENQPDFLPTWSRDGNWIYFGSGRSGTVQLWKMPAGGGEPVQITKHGGADARESPDGSLIYYTKVPEAGPGLWSMPVSGGEETQVLDEPRFGYWDVARKGIYFIDFNVSKDEPRPVKFFNFQTRKITQIGTVEKSVIWSNPFGFTVSPDSRWLLYTNLEGVEADLMLVDNYR